MEINETEINETYTVRILYQYEYSCTKCNYEWMVRMNKLLYRDRRFHWIKKCPECGAKPKKRFSLAPYTICCTEPEMVEVPKNIGGFEYKNRWG